MDAAALQARIDAALRDPLTGAPKLRFTPYLLVVATELQECRALMTSISRPSASA
jgi:hypothetical protein